MKNKPSKQRIKSKKGWRKIGGKRVYFRSMWEANLGRYFQFLKESGKILEWEHEPKTFWFHKIKRGCVSYLPDFKVVNLDGSHYWVEVKGYMDPKSATKIKRFRKYYPEEKLYVIGLKWFNENSARVRSLAKDWEGTICH